MTGIDELRRTLDVHARSVHDDGVSGRAGAARALAGRARRRRNAGVAVAAVVVMVAVTALTVLPGNDQPVPADRELNGHEAPALIESFGYTYRYVSGAGAGSTASVGFDASDGPWLVSWAADPGAPVRVTDGNGEVLGAQPGEFGDFAVVPSGSDTSYQVRGNHAALAVYELTGAAPAGYTVDGITFRDRVASDRLLAARIGKPGQSELTFDVEIPDGRLRADTLCAGAPDRTWVHIEIGGEGAVSTSGCQDDTFDPGAAGGYGLPEGTGGAPGETTSVRVWATNGQHGPRADVAELRLGLGLYEEGTPGEQVAAGDIPELQEQDGHTWRLTEVVESRPGDRSLQLEDTTEAATLVYYLAANTGLTMERASYNGTPTSTSSGTGGGGGQVTGPQLGPGTYAIRLGRNASPQSVLALAAYERID